MRIAAYPGSFNPPTVAHLAIASAALRQAGVDRVDLVVSELALGKEGHPGPGPPERLAVLEAVAATRPWLGARLTPHRLLVDIAAGYDVLVIGADKWAQLIDPSWYGGSDEARDRALALVPPLLIAPRPPHRLPVPAPPRVVLLDVEPVHGPVSSSAVRAGRTDWMLEEAAATGLWGCQRGRGSGK